MSEEVYAVQSPEPLIDSVLSCPACNTNIYCRKAVRIKGNRTATPTESVPDRGAGFGLALSSSEQEFVSLLVDEEKVFAATSEMRRLLYNGDREPESFSSSEVFPCPACGAAIQVLFQLVVIGARKVDAVVSNGRPVNADPLAVLSDSDRAIYDEWSRNGFFESWLKAASVSNPAQANPRNEYSKFQLIRNWFRLAVFLPVPRFRLGQFMQQYGSANIQVYQAQGVAAVVVDGAIKNLLPKSVAIGGRAGRKLATSGQLEVEEDADLWIKTKWGYTLGRGVYFEALRQESAGAFGSATRDQRR